MQVAEFKDVDNDTVRALDLTNFRNGEITIATHSEGIYYAFNNADATAAGIKLATGSVDPDKNGRCYLPSAVTHTWPVEEVTLLHFIRSGVGTAQVFIYLDPGSEVT